MHYHGISVAVNMQKDKREGLSSFGSIWRRQLCAKNTIPKSAGHTKTIVIVCEMMLKMILLEVTVVGRKTKIEDQSESR